MIKLSEEQCKAYVKKGGNSCPFCKSITTEGDEIIFDVGSLYQEMRCNTCDKRWTDDYTLTGVTPYEKGGN